MSLHERAAVWLIVGMCWTIMAMVLIYAGFLVGPTVERWALGPVVSKLKLTSLTADAYGNAVIEVEYTKHRDCAYVEMNWYRGKQLEGFERVSVTFPETTRPPATRPIGTQTSGPWVIEMPASEIESNSFAQLRHECHPLWTTTTDFYP